jgi:hypothetical protein
VVIHWLHLAVLLLLFYEWFPEEVASAIVVPTQPKSCISETVCHLTIPPTTMHIFETIRREYFIVLARFESLRALRF